MFSICRRLVLWVSNIGDDWCINVHNYLNIHVLVVYVLVVVEFIAISVFWFPHSLPMILVHSIYFLIC